MANLAFISAALLSHQPLSAQNATATQPTKPKTDQRVIVAIGAPGTEEFGSQFSQWAARWTQAASHTDFSLVHHELNDQSPKSQIESHLQELTNAKDLSEVWLVLIGHGTFDGKRAKFNLEGKDISAAELSEWLKPIKQRLVIVNCASSSSPFINALSAPNRIVVSSTKSGYEYNFSRFGDFLSAAVTDLVNDLDKDGQTSILEAFAAASQEVQAAYLEDNRLATEHALIDDNGDSLGTPADWFEGIRTVRQPKEGLADGLAANQVFLKRGGVDLKLSPQERQQRDRIETQLEQFRKRKSQMSEDAYLARIEPLLIKLARLYEAADSPKQAGSPLKQNGSPLKQDGSPLKQDGSQKQDGSPLPKNSDN